MKTVKTPTYNYIFEESNGLFYRWGKDQNDDPQYSPIGPEILDIEVSTICSQGCKFCYKSNKTTGKNMSFQTFKTIVDKIPTLTQIAFGIGDLHANPDLWTMFTYCREKGIVPNLTINGNISLGDARYLAAICGAVAVSNYDSKVCYRAVNMLQEAGLKQVNIHQLLAQESYTQIIDLMVDLVDGVVKPNAVVFLSLKKKGRGQGYTRISDQRFSSIIDYAMKNNLPIGFDSCTAHRFLNEVKDHPNYKEIEQMVEPCESGLFSSYINVDGIFHPCSFAEGFNYDLDVVNCEDFLLDVWYHPLTMGWRKKLLLCNRNCPLYTI
jgi:MoaA/NifB/PqqE/SkfB family radical SAM enzyme